MVLFFPLVLLCIFYGSCLFSLIFKRAGSGQVRYLLMVRVARAGSRLSPLLQGCGHLLSSVVGQVLMFSQGASSFMPTACFLGLWTDRKCDKLRCPTCAATPRWGMVPHRIRCSSGHVLFLPYILPPLHTLAHTHTHTHTLILTS